MEAEVTVYEGTFPAHEVARYRAIQIPSRGEEICLMYDGHLVYYRVWRVRHGIRLFGDGVGQLRTGEVWVIPINSMGMDR